MKFRWIIFFVLFFIPSISNSLELIDLRYRHITHSELKLVIEQFVLADDVEELDRWKKVYPDSFTNAEIGRAFYEVGLEYYEKNFLFLAVDTFLAGFNQFQNHSYKPACAYYIARIFYLNYDRVKALYYINRGMQLVETNHEMYSEMKTLRRRIRWQYISKWEGMPDNSISAVQFDGDDVWIGMWSGGCARYTRSEDIITLFTYENSDLISDYVRDIEVIGNKVYVATYDGLCWYNKRTSTWERSEGSLKYAICKRIKLIDYTVYVATLFKGLYSIDVASGDSSLFFSKSKNITDVYSLNDKLYISTIANGLYIYDGSSYEQLLAGTSIKAINEIDDELWIGTYGDGIHRLDPETDEITGQINSSDGISSDYIESMEIIRNRILVGTLGGGVSIYNQVTDEWSEIGILQGLPSQDVVTITVEDDYLWFGTLSGGLGILLTENFTDI